MKAEPTLISDVLRRETSLFDVDVKRRQGEIARRLSSSRVMVIGAAGSIGSAVVRELIPYGVSSLLLVDPNENGLAELVRELRSGRNDLPLTLSTHAIGLGTTEFERMVDASGDFDYVLNFAALKHVRAERDPFTLMRMLETNVLSLDRTLSLLGPRAKRFFSVSSDKAVRPASLMGASKRWMERILALHSDRIVSTSARFANVAFSAGSLLEGFLFRLQKRQPIAAPANVRRFFISEVEAAQLCVLAAVLGSANEIYVPLLSEADHAVTLEWVARRVLHYHGLEPFECLSEEAARFSPLLQEPQPRRWPCYFADADTTGEKEVEEFVDVNETLDRTQYQTIGVIRQKSSADSKNVDAARLDLERLWADKSWRKEAIVAAIRKAVPELAHTERGTSLDEKM